MREDAPPRGEEGGNGTAADGGPRGVAGAEKLLAEAARRAPLLSGRAVACTLTLRTPLREVLLGRAVAAGSGVGVAK